MQRVGVIAGDHQRRLNQLDQRLLAATAHLGIQAFQHVAQERPLGTARAGTAHLLMVIRHQQCALATIAFQQRFQAHEARQQVIQPRTGQQLLAQPDQ